MRDDWFGHRDPFTSEPSGERDEFTHWDFLLMEALQIVEDITDETGMLVMDQDDEAVVVTAVRKKNKFKAAIDNKTKGSPNKPYVPQPGEYFIPDITTRRSGGDRMSYTEWVKAQQKSD